MLFRNLNRDKIKVRIIEVCNCVKDQIKANQEVVKQLKIKAFSANPKKDLPNQSYFNNNSVALERVGDNQLNQDTNIS